MNNYIGKRFGKLIVLSKENSSQDRMSRWLCQCDCGNKHITRMRNLKNGDCKSCGCAKLTRFGDLNGSYFWRSKNGAKNRGLVFEITIKDAWDKFLQQKEKCAISGLPIKLCKDYRDKTQTASLDRIDSTKGYTLDNIQWIHKDINRMKMDMEEKIFFDWIKVIYEHKTLAK